MHALWIGLHNAFGMFWATLWALVLGFGISAALQAWVSTERMSRAFGQTNFSTMMLSTLLGAASSSCSYAAVVAARSAFQKGAALIPALAFMFASTNLVVELGAMIWALLGWRFVLAEVCGAFVLIGVMWILARLFFPADLEREAKQRSSEVGELIAHCCPGDNDSSAAPAPGRWARLANAFVMDWRMIWKELIAGFLVAGFLSALIPASWWKALFIQHGPPLVRLIENALVGPIIATLSWVCSCANIPLASLLWAHGISFGGVISFIYADLIVIPLIAIYWKYFGGRAAFYITSVFYLSMVIAGIVVDVLFSIIGLVPQGARQFHSMEHLLMHGSYTTWFNFAAIALSAFLLYVHLAGRSRPTRSC